MSTGDHDEPAYELTRNPVDETYGFVCREHAILRTGLTHQHALNVEAKHLREDHPDPMNLTLNLTEAARSFLHYNDQGSQSVWMNLVGLTDYTAALALAELCAAEGADVTGAVIPL